MKDVLTEAMDIVSRGVRAASLPGDRACGRYADSVHFARNLNANPYAYLDDAPLEERRVLAVEMRRVCRTRCLKKSAAPILRQSAGVR
jgi:ATP-dependent Lhr-like helicase